MSVMSVMNVMNVSNVSNVSNLSIVIRGHFFVKKVVLSKIFKTQKKLQSKANLLAKKQKKYLAK